MLNKRIYASEIRIHINDMVGSVKIHQLDEMHDMRTNLRSTTALDMLSGC